jgi:PTH1 family peptidyl-tRNA hydrolase
VIAWILHVISKWVPGLHRKTEQMEDWQSDMSNGKVLIAGLGNPGRAYRSNRHNIGFMAVDRLAETHGIDVGRVQQKAVTGTGRMAGRPVLLAKPQKFMNRSGDVIGPLAAYYKIEPADVLVIYDDIDLDLGVLRLREKGGSGGHNGMKSIIQHLGNDFPRLRLGVGRPPGRMDPAAYVLQDFGAEELPVVGEMLDQAVRAVETCLREGLDVAMTRFNGPVLDE